jgi:hypothetical protein
MNFYELPDQTLIEISKITPLTWFRICETVPFIGEWTPDPRTQKLVQKPFIEVIVISVQWLSTSKPVFERTWHLNGQVHRAEDLPAVIADNGDKEWFKLGVGHRDDDKPFMECANGDILWGKCGELHREGDLPAIIESNGDKYWYKFGKLYRDNNLPAIEYANGDKHWYINNKLHKIILDGETAD